MFHEQYTTKPDVVIVTPQICQPWTAEDMIDIFARLLEDGWKDPGRMSVSLSQSYGTRLGHYGLQLLSDQGSLKGIR